MLTAVLEVVAILLVAAVAGMFLGPWAALTRSVAELQPQAFFPVVRRLSVNMAAVMTVLMPLSIVSIIPLLVVTFAASSTQFWLDLAVFVALVASLLVTMLIEVPLVKQMESWNEAAPPPQWMLTRDRWVSFHLLRIVCGVVSLAALVVAAVLY